ncbi:hypothetical protein [Salmonella enterica subsp. enterica serovar Enteritidis]|uniref:Uncharacterized protein n=4 Tax=Salmonella enterica I TaxID=59201 RepID=A0A0F6AXJ0_SALT1|nr:conserved hypothetical protein [Salmonella enterica subsp. enterica serovar Typhimurium str. 14028S]EDZ01996.1 conserved hypothetical protein [Salmonella enterica subsp. enterica serovar Virchow str. SL491]EPI72853.1 hypothetical protein A672_02144 [Salmonella enterica subsp. enterica serovar Enteritidis str. 08-1080]EPI75015.1 hypothetical protein A673_00870 [Salmonella enterica subsp. enterica serovar Enteritidis str. 2009K0958]EPI87064.1 hypothetical protein A674_02168 [Salmonella enteric
MRTKRHNVGHNAWFSPFICVGMACYCRRHSSRNKDKKLAGEHDV